MGISISNQNLDQRIILLNLDLEALRSRLDMLTRKLAEPVLPYSPGERLELASSTMPEDLLASIRYAIAEKVELIEKTQDEGTREYLRGGLIDLIGFEFDTLKKAGAPTTTLSVDVDTSQLESALDDIASGLDKLRSYPGAGR